MTMQQMLLDMTLIANGDSVQVCWVTNLSQFADFLADNLHAIKEMAQNLLVWYLNMQRIRNK